jgi:hypothetical protein
MRGNAMRQLQEHSQPFPFGLSKDFYFHPTVSAANHGTDGYDHDVEQEMSFPTITPWIFY